MAFSVNSTSSDWPNSNPSSTQLPLDRVIVEVTPPLPSVVLAKVSPGLPLFA